MAASDQKYGNIIQALDTAPGVNRDTPKLSGDTYLDLLWARFYAKSVRKMGGMEKFVDGNDDPVRGMFQSSIENFVRIFQFRDSGVTQYDVLANGTKTAEINRTPVGWVIPSPGTPSYTFSVTSYTLYAEDTGESSEVIIFVAPPNSENPSQTIEAPVYFAPANSDSPFEPAGISTSGGVITFSPYIFVYGNNGVVKTNDGKSPLVWTTVGTDETFQFIVTNSKLLGAANSRAGLLLWSIDTLFIAQPNPNGPGFVTSTIAPEISLLSPSTIVASHNNTFLWVGNDQFYVYTGASNIVTNFQNHNYFYDNINTKYKGKIWGLYVGNFQEIWFFNVQEGYTEPNHLFIYNMQEDSWSDTPLARTSGLKKKFLDYPLLADANPNPLSPTIQYSVWEHEKGFDLVNDGIAYPIKSYFQSRLFDTFSENPQINLNMITRKFEPDIIQRGDITVEVLTYKYPKSDPVVSQKFTLTENDVQVDLSNQGRYVSYRFTSNTLGGFYQMGKNQINYQLGAVRP